MRHRWIHKASAARVDVVGEHDVATIHFDLPADDSDRSIQVTLATLEQLRREIGAALPPKRPRSAQV